MKRLIIFILAVIAITSDAENLKLMFINHGKVWVDGKLIQQGQSFNSDAKIRWEDNNQIIKVVGLDTHKVSVIPARTLVTGKLTTLSELLIQKQRLSSRDGVLSNIHSLIDFFDRPVALLNTIRLETGVLLDDSHFFFIQYKHENEVINKRLAIDGRCVILNDDIFKIDGIVFPPHTLTVKLFYYEVDNNRATTIADHLTIMIEPRKDCADFINAYLVDKLPSEELVEMIEDYCKIKYKDCYFNYEDLTTFIKNSDIKGKL